MAAEERITRLMRRLLDIVEVRHAMQFLTLQYA